MTPAPSSDKDRTFYLALARKAPDLSRAEEAELVTRYRDGGDRRAANVLARAYQRHVITLAMKYRGYGIPLGELVAEGNLGVVQALRRFELERGVRFGTYASYWVRAMMLAYVIKSQTSVGGLGGPLRSQMFFKLRRERARAYAVLGSGAAAEQELAQRLGVSGERLQSMLRRLDHRDVSLESQLPSTTGRLLDTLPSTDDQELELAQCQVARSRRELLANAIARLDSRERHIVEQHLLAETGEERSLAEIARTLQISRERARQLEERALGKLRRHLGESARALVA